MADARRFLRENFADVLAIDAERERTIVER